MHFFILSALAITVTSQLILQGSSEPLAGALSGSERGSDRGPGEVHSALRRQKRCSCSNMQDTECVYFCHVGIVWVNTPGQVVPYGLGNPLKRRKRELSRCLCTKASDAKCRSFCQSPTRVLRCPLSAKMVFVKEYKECVDMSMSLQFYFSHGMSGACARTRAKVHDLIHKRGLQGKEETGPLPLSWGFHWSTFGVTVKLPKEIHGPDAVPEEWRVIHVIPKRTGTAGNIRIKYP